ncbi:hypothetical protein BU24DRAFT_496728 [Aaosphaeria arxii CBS 175.79]|uniref:Mid2 domain-containing protein n=1 Tax=Aaosphaeria arxii CBS 175.79 TaxID=1450172 RepID=A0A6A5XA88_9PLEO|nr:uncharacterized protein BU24DRAFT_496728 [Aaosphaeria arxii CBS 175.79]KAF2009898.1 hypothetical protein BU24DRAFT_496728 [Aaosphaeria arxii CBS 175.79]
MARLSHLLSLLLFSSRIVSAAEQKCYGLNGQPQEEGFGPCKTGTRHSGCCAINRPAGSVDICLDNGLCMATGEGYMGTIWQSGCTDPTGQDPACPKLCPDVRDNFGGLKKVFAWNIQTCDFGKYCCREVGDSRNCCNNATAPQIETNFIGAFQFPTSTAGIPSSSSISLATTTSAKLSATPTPDATRTSEIVGEAVSTGTPFAQESTTSQPQTTCKPDKSAVVGGAVGGILGAALLGMMGVIMWMHRKEKRQRRLKEHYEEQFGQNFAYKRTVVVDTESSELLQLPTSPTSEKPIIIEQQGRAG